MSAQTKANDHATIDQWLRRANNSLANNNIATSRLDSLLIVEHLMQRDRAWLLAHGNMVLSSYKIRLLDAALKKRLAGWPLAYITGCKEFYGRDFVVNRHVLVPRAESEAIVDLLIKQLPDHVIDIGTGSGCLAITAALELPKASVVATDIDPNCLKVAQLNADRLEAKVEFVLANLASGLKLGGNTILLANLPYVPTDYPTIGTQKEPKLALYGGHDGLDYYRELLEQLAKTNRSGSTKNISMITESLISQHDDLAKLMANYGWLLEQAHGLAQLFVLKRQSYSVKT